MLCGDSISKKCGLDGYDCSSNGCGRECKLRADYVQPARKFLLGFESYRCTTFTALIAGGLRMTSGAPYLNYFRHERAFQQNHWRSVCYSWITSSRERIQSHGWDSYSELQSCEDSDSNHSASDVPCTHVHQTGLLNTLKF